ncbi:MAG: hypothetical protein AB7T49_05710 [Oligoflexales bacterium]
MKALVNIGILIMSLLAGCTKESRSKTSSHSTIGVSGFVFDSSGMPLGKTNIYVAGTPILLGTTGDRGQFEFSFSESMQASIRKNLNVYLGGIQPDFFQLYFEYRGEITRLGFSEKIRFDNAKHSLDKIFVYPPVTLTGSVRVIDPNGSTSAGSGFDVVWGNQRTLSNDQGQFTLEEAVSGMSDIYALKPGFVPGTVELAVNEPRSYVMPQYLDVYPASAVDGSFVIDGDQSDLPSVYAKRFAATFSSQASYVRYSNDPSEIETDRAGWRDRDTQYVYDFRASGSYKLYYQFADRTRSVRTEMRWLDVSLQNFESLGVVIGDGSGVITQRNIDIHIDVPENAVSMRVYHIGRDLDRMQFIPACDVIEYVFPIPSDPATAPIVEINVQFSDAQGNLSDVYTATAQLQPFFNVGTPFVIEGGDPATDQRVVQLDIDVPPNAYQMRVFESTSSGGGGFGGSGSSGGDPFGSGSGGSGRSETAADFWIPASEVYFHVFRSSGPKKVYLQFRDMDGLRSSVYEQTIVVAQFDPGQIGFVINGGDSDTVFRTVDIELLPPPNAVAFRFEEGTAPFFDTPWLSLVPSVSYSLKGYGVRTIYLQYLDAFDVESTVTVSSIFFDPFLGDNGDFEFDNSVPVNVPGVGIVEATDVPLVHLDIEVPIAAQEMRVFSGEFSEDNGEEFSGSGWMPVDDQASVQLSGDSGLKRVYVQFKTGDGGQSPTLVQSILYDPFLFYDPNLVVVNNGDATTNNVEVNVEIPVPDNAVAVSLSSHTGSGCSTTAPFTSVVSGQTVTIPHTLSTINGTHTVCARFKTFDGNTSSNFTDTIKLDIFPTTTLTALIENGDTSTTIQTVNVTLTPPPMATGIRMTEDLNSLATAPTFPAGTTVQFTLSAGVGTKTVYFQYVTNDGIVSNVFLDSIDLQ